MKSIKNAITMKATLILTIAFGIQISSLVASNISDEITFVNADPHFCLECPILSPKVPLEAPFSEMTEYFTFLNLMPQVPLEAPYESDLEVTLVANSFAPVFPLRADFEDNLNGFLKDDGTLAPVPPMTAEFSDTL